LTRLGRDASAVAGWLGSRQQHQQAAATTAGSRGDD